MYKRLFSDAPTENTERDRRLILGILLITSIILFALPTFGLISVEDRLPVLVAAIISTVTMLISYRGNTNFGRIIIPLLLNGAIGYFVYNGGLRDISLLGIAGVITISSILMGQTGTLFSGISMTCVIIATGLGEVSGQHTTYLGQYTQRSDIASLAILVMGTALLQYLLLNRLNQAVKNAKESLFSQTDANRELRTMQLELEQRVAERTAQLRASNAVGQVASSILDPDELINKVVNLITEQFEYYYAAIFIIEDNSRWAVLRDATGSAGQVLKSRRHRLQIGSGSMVGMAINTKEARVALDVGESAQRFNNPLLPNTRSEIALPLIVGERVIGALDVQSVREADFKQEDIDTLQSMANQVAIAMENARLFSQMDEALREISRSNRDTLVSAWTDRSRANTLEHVVNLPPTSSNPEFKEIELPLTLREHSIGHINIQTENDWTSEDQSWAESLATQVAVSIENARLFEESQQAALREHISAAIIQKIWSAGSIDAIMQTTIRELSRSLGASEASIELKLKADE